MPPPSESGPPPAGVIPMPLRASLLRHVLWTVLAAIMLAWLPLTLTGRWRPSLILAGTALLLALALAAAQRNQARLAGWLLLAPLTACVGILTVTGKGPIDEAVLTLPGLMIFASLFVSQRTYLALLALIGATLVTMGIGHSQGWYAPSNTDVRPDTFITVIVILTATSYFVWLLANALRATLASLEVENQRVHQSLEQIRDLAHHDPLTGLANRALARDRFERAMAQAMRSQTSAALIYLDLDNFKTVNDSLGHAAGDMLLSGVATRLSACVRAGDTVSRQGGDEFLVVLGDIGDEAAVASIAMKLVERMTEPFEVAGVAVAATCSLGIALFPANGGDFDTLLKHADMAMYKAKEAGRNALRFYDERMNADVAEHLHLIAAMRAGLANYEFELHYQPQFRLADQQVTGAEALLRWRHPQLGSVPPARFIPLAERSGLIVELGNWVLHEACRQVKAWQKAGLAGLVVAVNVSPVQLRRDGFREALLQALRDSGLPPNHIGLELTESSLLADSPSQRELLAGFRALGVHLSIDDFGTGYSALSYLRQFEVEQLKIDQSFVRNLKAGAQEHGIVRAIIQIASSLGLESVAEGIEDEATLATLQDMGCRTGQGFYWSRALPADEFLRFCQERRAVLQA